MIASQTYVLQHICILIAVNEPLTAEGSLDREVSMPKFEKVAQEQDNVFLFSLHDCLSRWFILCLITEMSSEQKMDPRIQAPPPCLKRLCLVTNSVVEGHCVKHRLYTKWLDQDFIQNIGTRGQKRFILNHILKLTAVALEKSHAAKLVKLRGPVAGKK